MARDWLGVELRPWQQYAADRILEVDKDGRLRWPFVVLTVGRQQGKSTLLAALSVWRMLQAGHFGEPQHVTSVSQSIQVARQYWMPVALDVRERDLGRSQVASGMEYVQLADGSGWRLLPAKMRKGYTSSLVVVDEAWTVDREVVEQALMPQMIQRDQAQMLIVSTAGEESSDLLSTFRDRALAGDRDTLLLEWSAPPEADADDENGWQWALPVWDAKRRAWYRRLRAATSETAWQVEYMNQWVRAVDGWVSRREWMAGHRPHTPGSNGVCVVDQALHGEAWGAVWASQPEDGDPQATVVRAYRSARAPQVWEWVRGLPDSVDVRIGVTVNGRQPDDIPVNGVCGSRELKAGIRAVQSAIRAGMVWHDNDQLLTEHVLRSVARTTPNGQTVFHVGGPPDDLSRMLVIAVDLVGKRQRGPVMV